MTAPPPGPPAEQAHPRARGRGLLRHAHGGCRRPRPRVVQLAAARLLRGALLHPGGSRLPAPGPVRRPLGGRRRAGHLLLRGGSGAQAEVRRRLAARPQGGGAADDRRRLRHGGPRPRLHRRPARRRRRDVGMGRPHRHRHRLRGGAAVDLRARTAPGGTHLPAHPRRRRRPARHHRHRRLLLRRSEPAAPAERAGGRRRLRRARAPRLHRMVRAHPAGRGRLVPHARLGRARHHRRSPAGSGRAGPALPRRAHGHDRALHAPDAPVERGPCPSRLRPLRRRRQHRRLRRSGPGTHGPGGAGHLPGPAAGQDPGYLGLRRRAHPCHPAALGPRHRQPGRAGDLRPGGHRLHGVPAHRGPGLHGGDDDGPRPGRRPAGHAQPSCSARCCCAYGCAPSGAVRARTTTARRTWGAPCAARSPTRCAAAARAPAGDAGAPRPGLPSRGRRARSGPSRPRAGLRAASPSPRRARCPQRAGRRRG